MTELKLKDEKKPNIIDTSTRKKPNGDKKIDGYLNLKFTNS